jgi:hypothetical protein
MGHVAGALVLMFQCKPVSSEFYTPAQVHTDIFQDPEVLASSPTGQLS